MNPRVVFRATAVLAVVGGMAIGTAPGAFAAAAPAPSPVSGTPTPVSGQGAALAALKAHCDDAAHRRLGSLSSDASYVAQSRALTGPDRTTLAGQISADRSGLTALDATIQADTTVAQARTDCQKIVADYHVYVLEEPKIHEVIAADGVTAANAAFTKLIPELQALINTSAVPADQKARAQTALEDLRSKVTASTTSISGVTASVINLTASGYPGNAVVLKSAAQNISTAKGDLDGARGDVNTILHALGH